MTERYDVTAVGAPWYVSAVHRWNGTSEILNPRPEKKNTKAIICRAEPVRCCGMSLK